MCLLSKNAIKNPDTAEAQVEAWAWRQLDGLLHTGNYEGVATFEANGFTVVEAMHDKGWTAMLVKRSSEA